MSRTHLLERRLIDFVAERGWMKFHTPRNLATSISLEAGELLEHFQWDINSGCPPDQRNREELADEAADIFIYLLLFCQLLGVDIIDAAHRKIDKNAIKYPVEKSRGVSTKYDKLPK